MDISVYLDIEFYSSDSALITRRLVNSSLIIFLGALLGSIFGLMGTVGNAMKSSEIVIDAVNSRIIKKKKIGDLRKRQRDIRNSICDTREEKIEEKRMMSEITENI